MNTNSFFSTVTLAISILATPPLTHALPKKVVGGHSHTIVIDGENDYVYTMGEAAFGNVPGIQPLENTWETPDQRTPIYSGMHNMRMVDSKDFRSVGIDDDGYLWRFGLDHNNAPIEPSRVDSMGDLIDVTLTSNSMYMVKSNGTLLQWNMDPDTSPVSVLENVKFVDGGADFVIAMTTIGDIYTSGSNTQGQRGLGHFDETLGFTKVDLQQRPAKTIAAGNRHAVVVLEDGGVANWGYGYQGLMGINDRFGQNQAAPVYPTIDDVVDATATVSGTTLLTGSGSVYVYGYHSLRVDYLYSMDRIPREVPSFTGAQGIYSGHDHTFVKTYDGKYMGWGMATKGRLGIDLDNLKIVHYPMEMASLAGGYVAPIDPVEVNDPIELPEIETDPIEPPSECPQPEPPTELISLPCIEVVKTLTSEIQTRNEMIKLAKTDFKLLSKAKRKATKGAQKELLTELKTQIKTLRRERSVAVKNCRLAFHGLMKVAGKMTFKEHNNHH